MKVIVLSRVIKEKHISQLKETAEKTGAQILFVEDEEEITDEFKDAEVLYGFGMEYARTNPALKWLCVPSAGVDYLMGEDSFANKECLLTNSSGAYGVAIAEHIIAVSLMMMRKLTEFYPETLDGKWQSPRPQSSLYGSRITVLGTGDIGSAFAERAKAFSPENIIGINRSGRSENEVYDCVYPIDQIDRILPKTDLLVMSLPDTPETVNILSKERIGLLPKTAYVVNVGRGSAIDEDALSDALDAGELAGAALDVFKTEPLPSKSRMWKTRNLLITPHVAGGLTLPYTLDVNVEMFCENLIRYSEGKELKNLIDKKKGY